MNLIGRGEVDAKELDDTVFEEGQKGSGLGVAELCVADIGNVNPF